MYDWLFYEYIQLGIDTTIFLTKKNNLDFYDIYEFEYGLL
jgi:hypothetical protein